MEPYTPIQIRNFRWIKIWTEQKRQPNKRLALRELTHNQNLIINKADEGSTIVVEDRDDYISNAMEHLNNPNVFKPLNDNISNDLKQNIIKNCSEMDLCNKIG